MPSPGFNKRLLRATKIVMQEIHDGCVKCRNKKRWCKDCTDAAVDLAINPRGNKALQDLLKTKAPNERN
jgi:hypothetical protein